MIMMDIQSPDPNVKSTNFHPKNLPTSGRLLNVKSARDLRNCRIFGSRENSPSNGHKLSKNRGSKSLPLLLDT